MLINEVATDAVLGRGTAGFGPMVAGRALVCMVAVIRAIEARTAAGAAPRAEGATREHS